jgi:hypothetical protein
MTGGFLIELDNAAERVFRILNLLLLSINVITLNIYASELHSHIHVLEVAICCLIVSCWMMTTVSG